jgi:DNA-binding response OmpR family regulator
VRSAAFLPGPEEDGAMPAKRILLVEDEREVANTLTLTLALRSGDYDVEFAHTAEQARARLNSGRFDLVITDWRLPDGDGLDVADTAADNGTKTMLVSGYLFQMPAERAQRHEVLMKPLRAAELLEMSRTADRAS